MGTITGGGATGMQGLGEAEFRRRAADELVADHDATLRRTARRFSLCRDDAEDAYQRSLEILLTKAPPITGENLLRWMQVVTKREALAVRRQRERVLSPPRTSPDGDDRDPLDSVASEGPGPTDTVASRERVARSGEALQALKPAEVRALILKAEGYSYAEIGRITGWTYTKINRCMAEGRKRFFEVFDAIERGERCAGYAETLSAFADGELEGDSEADLRRHLRTCARCRARLRAYRGLPGEVLSALGPGAAAAHPGAVERLGAVGDKLAGAVDKAREAALGLVVRAPADGAASMAMAGGSRGAGMAGIAKLVMVCGATAAGSAACVASGVIAPGQVGLGSEPPPALEQPAERPLPAPSLSSPEPAGAESAATTTEGDTATPQEEPAVTQTPAEQTEAQFGIEASSAGASGGGSASSGESAGSNGGTAGGGSPGGSGDQFGFQ